MDLAQRSFWELRVRNLIGRFVHILLAAPNVSTVVVITIIKVQRRAVDERCFVVSVTNVAVNGRNAHIPQSVVGFDLQRYRQQRIYSSLLC